MDPFIQAIVNTINTGTNIQSKDIKERRNKENVNLFYHAMDKVFNFVFGKVLLATSSFSQLRNMVNNNLPYLTKYSKEIDQCLNYSDCTGIWALLQSLGKLK